MIRLSYSTINSCLQPHNSHNWQNKMMGIEVPDNEYFRNGHRIQKIVSDHLTGITVIDTLQHLEEKVGSKFDIFEKEQKWGDPRCKLTRVFNILGEEVMITGFFDMKDSINNRCGEVKAYGKMWSVGQFARSYQRKMYGLLEEKFVDSVLITALPDESQWGLMPPKVYCLPYTPKDREEALKWITDAVALLKKGDFTGGLVDGKCIDAWCLYAENCQFK